MNRHNFTATVLAGTLALSQAPVHACGEGQFNMGHGLRYQGYLTPRPATVLVYDDGAEARKTLYAGLQKAGHKVTVVGNSRDLSEALRARRFDVVISDLDDVAAIQGDADSAPASPRVLPVVERSRRNAPDVRSRFRVFLLDGASLGQYLKSIDLLVKGTTT